MVSVSEKPRERLQAAIRKKLGFQAKREARETDVLALKVVDTGLPGLTLSAAGEKGNVNYRDGKLWFTHLQPGAMSGGLEQILKRPVVDRTDMTNFYNFSTAWNIQIERQLQNETNARAVVSRIIGGWGLALEPDTASIDELVVRTAK